MTIHVLQEEAASRFDYIGAVRPYRSITHGDKFISRKLTGTDHSVTPQSAVTWIVVANGCRARIFEKVGEEAIRPAKSSDFYGDCGPQGPLDRTMSMQSFREPSDDDRKRDFAKAVSAHLEQNFNEGNFDRLVLVAPPQTLGDLKGALPTSLRARVMCNIQRNLMHAASFELAGYLGAAIRD